MERRERSFPVRFEVIKPTRFTPENLKMYYAHEWEAYQKTLHHDRETNSPDTDSASNGPAANFPEPDPSSAEPGTAAPQAIAPVPTAQSSTSSISSTSSHPSLPPDFSRHSRLCCVCSHPDRETIDGDFIRWRSPELIAKEFKIADRASIYRHAHATGLFAWRKRELGRVLEGILESAEHIPLESSDVLVRAARLYSHLDDNGRWLEPPRTTFIFTGEAPPIYPLEGLLPSNSARAKKRRVSKPILSRHERRPRSLASSSAKQKRMASAKPNSNIRPNRKSVKLLNRKEKANS